MTALEALKPNVVVRGVLPNGTVTVMSVKWYCSEAIELTYKDAAHLFDRLLAQTPQLRGSA